MKEQKKKLVFGKHSITELNDQQAFAINGGTDTGGDNGPTTYVCSNCIPDGGLSVILKKATVIDGGN